MPYSIRKAKEGGFDILRKDTGEVVGHSDTKRKAQRSVQARYINEDGRREHPWFRARRPHSHKNSDESSSHTSSESNGTNHEESGDTNSSTEPAQSTSPSTPDTSPPDSK